MKPATRNRDIGHRSRTEVPDPLAGPAPDPRQALRVAAHTGNLVVDGTPVPIDRLWYPGEHRRHGGNVQLLADPRGELI